MKVKIYLRSIKKDGENRLALFDSNRNGDIDDLTTGVQAGASIIWKLDCCSGIKSVSRIYSKKEKHTLFKCDPKKRLLCEGFKVKLKEGVTGEEYYTIECILCNGDELKIDPMIRVPPPPTKGG
jgi:hypothetical protein